MGLFNSDNRVAENNALSKEHIGIVIDIKDPKNLGRVRVAIPKLLESDNQVWFTRIAPNFPGVVYATPRLGQRIRVWFKDNSLSSGVYGLDYVHKETGLSLFQPGEYGFADVNSNMFKVSGGSTTYRTNSFKLDTALLNVTGSIMSGNGYTGAFTTGDGRIVSVTGGIITDIT